MTKEVFRTITFEVTTKEVQELCDFLNEQEFHKEVLSVELVKQHPELFNFLFQLEVCGWFIGNTESMFDIWAGDGWCGIGDVLDECGIEYDDE